VTRILLFISKTSAQSLGDRGLGGR
jgi:hypothetical protein